MNRFDPEFEKVRKFAIDNNICAFPPGWKVGSTNPDMTVNLWRQHGPDIGGPIIEYNNFDPYYPLNAFGEILPQIYKAGYKS